MINKNTNNFEIFPADLTYPSSANLNAGARKPLVFIETYGWLMGLLSKDFGALRINLGRER